MASLKVTPDKQVEFLIGPAQFHIRLHGHGIIALEERIIKFQEGDIRLLLKPLFEVGSLQHLRDRGAARQIQEARDAERIDPRTVEPDLGRFRFEHTEHLVLVGFRVLPDLLRLENRARGGLA